MVSNDNLTMTARENLTMFPCYCVAKRKSLMSQRALVLAVLSACALTAGCQSGPRVTPNLALPAGFEAPAATSGMAAAPLDAWWTAFNDAALTDLIETALKAAPDARIAGARVEEAIATRRSQYDSAVFPTGQVVGNAARGNTDTSGFSIPGFNSGGDTRNYSANFNVSWELDLIGRRRHAVRAIDAELAAARFNAEAAKASLAANVAQSYFQIRALDVQLENARDSARVQGSLADLATRKANVGLGAGADADRVAGDVAQAQAQVAALETQLQAARRSPADPGRPRLRPRSPAWSCRPARRWSSRPRPQTTPGELLARRPDVRESAARLISADRPAQGRRAGHLPDLRPHPRPTRASAAPIAAAVLDHDQGLDPRRRGHRAGAEHPHAAGRHEGLRRARRPGGPGLREGGADRLWRGRERPGAAGFRPAAASPC